MVAEFEQVDTAAIRLLIERLYEGLSGYALSHGERTRLGLLDRSVTYGEVEPGAFLELLGEVAPRTGETFFDLGSGTGKAVLLAAMASGFSRLVGVELLGDLGAAARKILARYDTGVRPSLPPGRRDQRIEFRDADLLQVDLSGADVVFLHSICFERALLEALALKLERLRPGARVISVGQRLASPALVLRRALVVEMEWGQTFASVYARR